MLREMIMQWDTKTSPILLPPHTQAHDTPLLRLSLEWVPSPKHIRGELVPEDPAFVSQSFFF